jgi:endonuclease/exonuclease/phosphatase family metal-dependent hydrolase
MYWKGGYQLRVMTFNLRCDVPFDFGNRWDNRKNIVYYIMKEYKCDIIGTQEVRDNMVNDIRENFQEYNIIGEPRGNKVSSERNNLLISKKHTIKEHKTFWLSEKPDKMGSRIWHSYLPRICTTAVVEINGGKKVRICNTHLDNLFSKTREYGLKKIMEFIKKEQEKEELPVILMGDFNATPHSRLIKNLKEGKYYEKKLLPVQDLNKSLYNEATRDNFKRTERGIHIDYIFVSEEIEVVNVKIIKYNINGKYPSDHYPLMSDIIIN